MTLRWRTLGRVAAVVVAVTVLAALVVVHLPSVQRSVWQRIAASIEESTGWRIETEAFSFRAMPARLRARGITVETEGRIVASLASLEARWRWRSILATPPRFEVVIVEDPEIHPDALPDRETSTGGSDQSVWHEFEIGTLRLAGGGGSSIVAGIEIAVDGVRAEGSLVSGRATATLSARQMVLSRDGRNLDLGPVAVEGRASEEGVHIGRLEVGSEAASLRAQGDIGPVPVHRARIDVAAAFDLPVIAGWWDPNLVSGLEPSGRLSLDGQVSLTEKDGLVVDLHHHGETVRLAGYELDEVDISFRGGVARLHVGHPGWGEATVNSTGGDVFDIAASLDRAPVDRVLGFVAPGVAEIVGRPAVLSGAVDGTVSFPVVPEMTAGKVDLELQSPIGRVAVRADGAGTSWRFDAIEAEVAGVVLRASGTVDARTGVAAAGALVAENPSQVVEALARWFPSLRDVGVGGGAVSARFRVNGPLENPDLEATVGWNEPVAAGRRIEYLNAGVSGTLERCEWEFDAQLAPESDVAASGSARPLGRVLEGVWRARVGDLGELSSVLGVDAGEQANGDAEADGRIEVAPGSFAVDGRFSASSLGFEGWSIGAVSADFSVDPSRFAIENLEARMLSGEVEGRLSLGFAEDPAPVTVALDWHDLDLAEVPLEVPEPAIGRLSGHLALAGTVVEPEAELDVLWSPSDGDLLPEGAHVRAALADGKLQVISDRIDTVAGPIWIDASVPLGDLPLPDRLWPDAIGGPVRATVRANGFRTAPLQRLWGLGDVVGEATGDVHGEIEWNPREPDRPRVLIEVRNLVVRHPEGDLVARGPLEITLDGARLEVEPVVLEGGDTRIETSAAYDPETGIVTGRLRALIAPTIAGMLPLPITIDGPITINADLQAPAERSLSLEAIHGSVVVDHTGGRIVMRDPPVEIRDLQLVASLDDGVLSDVDGSAEVNRGHVEVGGSWDPESGQGVIFELDNVTTMVEGILTQWDGQVAVEPHPEMLANVYGDLSLVVGLWDERFDLASAVLAGESTTVDGDDILHDIGLDLTVRGGAGIRVENNLGRFDVNWDQLRIGGTAAAPVLRGDIRIAPGGVLVLAGHEVRVQRGVVGFTGNPETDPILEITPETDTTLFGGEQETFNATDLAARGLASGISSALGFENETLRPAEIAVQTEKDPSERFMVGQRLSRQLALFLATNLKDVQDRMTMLQFWNIPRLKGLAFQTYQETQDDNAGVNVFQRFEWGGTRTADDRPSIYRVRLEGEWPLSQRGLQRATRFHRGQPYDEFLLFVGSVRLERFLSEHGYQSARVAARREGPQMSPTLVFSCEPGPYRAVRFEGDALPGDLRREVTALYQPPPLETAAIENMRSVVRNQMVVAGFLSPQVTVERREDSIVVDVRRGVKAELRGPYLEGVPTDVVPTVVASLGEPAALAVAADRPDWAKRVVERTLRNAGYLDASVVDVSVRRSTDESAEVHVVVDAGLRRHAGSVEFVGPDPLGLTSEFARSLEPGMPLDRSTIDAVVRDLRHAYVEAGYRDASVRSTIDRDENGVSRITVRLDPGRQRTVREIRFTGRRHASERVLLKGVTLAPGEVVTDADLDQSAARIANFSPIERAAAAARPVGVSDVDVEIAVVEKKRWSLEAGGGWSTERGFGAAFGVRDGDLFGRGVGLNLRGSFDSTEKRLFLIGSVPPVPGGRLSFISTLGFSSGDAPDDPDYLNQDEQLASIEASYRLPRNVQVGLYYRWTDTRTYEKVPSDFFPFDVTVQVGMLGARTVIDRFDYLFDPRKGWGLTSDVGWSGGTIGSDLEYVSWLSGFSLALEPYRNATWMQSLRLGVADPLKGTSLDREARFFAGGQASVRGFDLNSVGPLTFGLDGSLVPAGGGALFVLNEEMRIPIWDPLRLAVFADVGQVWESWREADFDFAVGVGFGIRWSTPIGPLWADVAWPVANVGISSSKPKFYLGIGRPF